MQKSSTRIGVRFQMNAAAGAANALQDECAMRFREWVRGRAPRDTQKIIAEQLGACPETVHSWIGDRPRMPGVKHLLVAIACWGPEFVAYVLAPCGEWTRSLSFQARTERMRREIEDLRREVDSLEALHNELDLLNALKDRVAAHESALSKITEE